MDRLPHQTIAVIGCFGGGLSTAIQIKQRCPHCTVVIFEKVDPETASLMGSHYLTAPLCPFNSELNLIDLLEAQDRLGIEVRLEHEVTAINTTEKQLLVSDNKAGQQYHFDWDQLVVATGSRPVTAPIEGLDRSKVFFLKEEEQLPSLQKLLDQTDNHDITIIGGGHIPTKMAQTLKLQGHDVRLLVKGEHLLHNYHPIISRAVSDELVRCGIEVLLQPESQIASNVPALGNGLVLVHGGLEPNTSLARAAGIEIGSTGAIAIDPHCRTSIEGIYAVGHCTEVHHLVLDQPAWIPYSCTAERQSRVAAANLTGVKEKYGGCVGTYVFGVFDLEVARTGIGPAEIISSGLDCVSAVSDTKAEPSRPDSPSIRTVIYVDRTTGRLLGAQMMGQAGVAKRIDVFATALHASMTVDQVRDLDLAWTSPFSPGWDPVVVATVVAKKQLFDRERSDGKIAQPE